MALLRRNDSEYSGVEDYFNRSGDEKLSPGSVETYKDGFCVWRIHDDSLVLVNVYKYGEYWNQWATKKAKERGLKKVMFATKRNPEGFERKFGFKLTGYILERDI